MLLTGANLKCQAPIKAAFLERNEVGWCVTHQQLDRMFRHSKVHETEEFNPEQFEQLDARRKK